MQRHMEDGATRPVGGDPELAVMAVDDGAADGEAHARAGRLVGTKRGEDTVGVFGADAGAVIRRARRQVGDRERLLVPCRAGGGEAARSFGGNVEVGGALPVS